MPLSQPIPVQYRYTHDVEQARRMGWTKNHLLIECFAWGKWRCIGYFTPKQIERQAWKEKAFATLQTNGTFRNLEPDARPTSVNDLAFQNCSDITLP